MVAPGAYVKRMYTVICVLVLGAGNCSVMFGAEGEREGVIRNVHALGTVAPGGSVLFVRIEQNAKTMADRLDLGDSVLEAWTTDQNGTKKRLLFSPVWSNAVPTDGTEIFLAARCPVLREPGEITFANNGDLRVTLESLSDESIEEINSFEKIGGYDLVIRGLIGKPVTLTAESRASFKSLRSADKNPINRYISFIVGYNIYTELWKRFNNNGAPGTYAPCYKSLETVVRGEERDLIWLEAVRLLMCAKVLNGDVDEGNMLAEQLTSNVISSSYRMYGRKAKASLVKYRQKVEDGDGE